MRGYTVREYNTLAELRKTVEIKNQLFEAANTIILDGCPSNPETWFCRKTEDYDEGVCTRCWCNYLLRVLNGAERTREKDAVIIKDVGFAEDMGIT